MLSFTIPYATTLDTTWSALETMFVPGGEQLIEFNFQFSGEPHFRIYNREKGLVEQVWDTLFGIGTLQKDTRLQIQPGGATLELQWCSPMGGFGEIISGILTVAPADPMPPNLVITPYRPPTSWERIMGDPLGED